MAGHCGLSLYCCSGQTFVRFNDVFAKVQLEIFLRSAVANGISLGMPNKSVNKPDTNSEAVRVRHILAYTQR